MGKVKNFEARVFGALRREPPQSKVHRLAFWLLVIYLALAPGRLLPGSAGSVFGVFSAFTLLLLIAFCMPLVWRWIFGRFLWKLRNRLIVTYLLMGLTPVVLFVLLALIALYVFSGQFAIFAATSAMEAQLERYAEENRAFCVHVAHFWDTHPGSKSVFPPPEMEDTAPGRRDSGLRLAAFQDGKPISILPADLQADITQVPSWARDGFHGAVLDNNKLYLRAINTQSVNGHTTTVIISAPINKASIDGIAQGIGRIEILPNF